MENNYITGNDNIDKFQSVFIFTPTVTLNAYMIFEKKIKDIIGEDNLLEIEKIGIKNLAYEIKNFKKGFYVVIHFKGNFKTTEELEKYYKTNHNIIKFITIKEED